MKRNDSKIVGRSKNTVSGKAMRIGFAMLLATCMLGGTVGCMARMPQQNDGLADNDQTVTAQATEAQSVTEADVTKESTTKEQATKGEETKVEETTADASNEKETGEASKEDASKEDSTKDTASKEDTTKKTDSANNTNTTAATNTTTQATTQDVGGYMTNRGVVLATDASGNIAVNADGYCTQVGIRSTDYNAQGRVLQIYAAEPGPVFNLEFSEGGKIGLRSASDTSTSLVKAWWDGTTVNAVIYCNQCPVNTLYSVDLSAYASELPTETAWKADSWNHLKEDSYDAFWFSTVAGIEYVVDLKSMTLVSTTGTNGKLIDYQWDGTTMVMHMYCDEVGEQNYVFTSPKYILMPE